VPAGGNGFRERGVPGSKAVYDIKRALRVKRDNREMADFRPFAHMWTLPKALS
jgi:hypothetical protein